METIIRYVFAAIALLIVAGAIVLGWKERLYPETIKGREVVRYGNGAKLMALVTVIAAAMTIGAKLNAEPDDEFLATILVIIFCPIAVLVVLEVFFVRVEFDNEKIYVTVQPYHITPGGPTAKFG
jgi:hypothetical protein